MSQHEILGKKITIVKLHPKKNAGIRHLEFTPAIISNFTVADWLRIFNDVQLYPLKPKHYFHFLHGRYYVELYEPEPEDEDDILEGVVPT